MVPSDRIVTQLLDLPDDALRCVLVKLSLEDVCSVARTCRLLHAHSNDDTVWLPRCKAWEKEVNIAEWRRSVFSTKALYRLLRYFSKIVGVWSAQELYPRGGILFITWGKGRLVASRVLPKGSNSRGALLFKETLFIRLFELVGLPDGSSKMFLLSARAGSEVVRLPGCLVWNSSDTKDSFHFDMYGLGSASAQADREPFASAGSDAHSSGERCSEAVDLRSYLRALATDETRLIDSLQQRFLMHNMAHGAEQQLIQIPQQMENEGPASSGGNRAIRYMMRLATRGELQASCIRVWQSEYARLTIGEPKLGQELNGLWSGIYGPHGLEVVRVSYKDDEIVATKVLGDPNVPCGEDTFKVRIDTMTNNIPVSIQTLAAAHMSGGTPPELVKMYRGFGRIADHNFRSPQWVGGRLLVDSSGNISFLWEDADFLIQFQRFNLESM